MRTLTIKLKSLAILTRKSIEEHRESRDPNHPRDYIDCYLDQVVDFFGSTIVQRQQSYHIDRYLDQFFLAAEYFNNNRTIKQLFCEISFLRRSLTFVFTDMAWLCSSQMERDKEFDQEGLELTCLDLFKVLTANRPHSHSCGHLCDQHLQHNRHLSTQAGAETSSTTLMWWVSNHLSSDDTRSQMT